MVEYIYQKVADLSLLTVEINNSHSISQEVGYMNLLEPDALSIFFENDLTQNEQTVLAGLVNAHDASKGGTYQENYHLSEYVSGKLTKETWYETDNGDGTYSNKARDIVYSWTTNYLTSYTESIYYKSGTLKEKEVYNYYTNGMTVIEKKT